MTDVEVFLLVAVAVVAGLGGAGLAVLGMRRAERRRCRWLDQRAAERIASFYPLIPPRGRRR